MRPCQICGELTPNLCDGCNSVAYCDTNHQAEHWIKHKHRCQIGMKPPSTVDADSFKNIQRYYKYKLYERKQVSDAKFKKVLSNVKATLKRVCKDMIYKTFFDKIKNTVDLAFVLSHKQPTRRGTALTIIDTYVLATFQSTTHAYIHLVCNQEVTIGGKRIKTGLGAVIHGVALHFLKERGIQSISLEASKASLISYYSKFGYELSTLPCDEPSPPFQWILDDPDNLPPVTGPNKGWMMRLCDITTSPLYFNLTGLINTVSKTLDSYKNVEDFQKLYMIQPRDRSPVRK